MPIAAVPAYLGQDFKEASPGLKFSIYLPIWTDRADQEKEVLERANKRSHEGQETRDLLERRGMDAAITTLRQRNRLPGLWEKNDFAAKKAWGEVKELSTADKGRINAIVARQMALAAHCPREACLTIAATAIAPFTTGLGNEHPLENGFAFLWPYGLPYLPGSGVKGVVRRAAEELASGEWGDTHGWSTNKVYSIAVDKKPITLSVIDVLFGLESGDGETEHVRGALSFWDVIPQIKGNSLMVEIMTPHQKHYYQDSQSPHDSGQPTPITFLTVPPGSEFTFYVQCDLAHLKRLAPELAENGKWKQLLEAAFTHAFDWLGFGAKTAVGYGAMTQSSAKAERGGGSFSVTEEVWESATIKWDAGGGGRVTASTTGKSAMLFGKEAERFLAGLSDEQRNRLKKKKELKSVRVVVEVMGNEITLKRLA